MKSTNQKSKFRTKVTKNFSISFESTTKFTENNYCTEEWRHLYHIRIVQSVHLKEIYSWIQSKVPYKKIFMIISTVVGITVSEIFQPLLKSLESSEFQWFGFHLGQRAKIFSQNSFKYFKFENYFELFELVCSNECLNYFYKNIIIWSSTEIQWNLTKIISMVATHGEELYIRHMSNIVKS
jgi:hypothetical protein